MRACGSEIRQRRTSNSARRFSIEMVGLFELFSEPISTPARSEFRARLAPARCAGFDVLWRIGQAATFGRSEVEFCGAPIFASAHSSNFAGS